MSEIPEFVVVRIIYQVDSASVGEDWGSGQFEVANAFAAYCERRWREDVAKIPAVVRGDVEIDWNVGALPDTGGSIGPAVCATPHNDAGAAAEAEVKAAMTCEDRLWSDWCGTWAAKDLAEEARQELAYRDDWW